MSTPTRDAASFDLAFDFGFDLTFDFGFDLGAPLAIARIRRPRRGVR